MMVSRLNKKTLKMSSVKVLSVIKIDSKRNEPQGEERPHP